MSPRLDVRIALERPASASDDLGAALGFEPAGEVWAGVEVLTAAEAGAPLDGRGLARLRLTLRQPSPAGPGWRVRLRGQAYRIAGRSARPRDPFLTLDCEEEP